MRIVHVTDFYLPRLGGIELHVADLSLRQRAQGHDVRIMTSSPGSPEDGVTRLVSGRLQHVFHPAATRRGLAELLA